MLIITKSSFSSNLKDQPIMAFEMMTHTVPSNGVNHTSSL